MRDALLRPAAQPLSPLSKAALEKAPTGVHGLDDLLSGGLPRGRPSLVCGAAGCGKTLFGMQFLVRGALLYDEPGVFIAFEERAEDLVTNVASLGFDLDDLQRRNLLYMDHIRLEPQEIIENGEYDLEGLFLRLGLAIDAVGAKRVVIDTLEILLGGLSNYGVVRAELRRLFEWLKDRGVTAIITAERGEGKLTRHGLEEYVSDCVIVLDHRVEEQVSTRRLRVVKYRGSTHGTNEYPFLIDESGISVLPVTSAGLDHHVSNERVSSGVARLDTMLGGEGYYRGSTVLVSGTAGSGKSSLCAHFADARCRAGERVLYLSFEESAGQIVRNMRAIGVDLARWVDAGLLRFATSRPTAHGLETHLALIHRHIVQFEPAAVILDPVSNFSDAGGSTESHSMLVRLVDFLKSRGITGFLTSLTAGGAALEQTETAISSVVDTWLLVKSIELSGERNRGLYVLKSRGMAHSNQVREFLITDRGIELVDVYVGPSGVLTGLARAHQEASDRQAALERERELESKRRLLERRRALFREKLAKLQAEFDSESFELESSITSLEGAGHQEVLDRRELARRRSADTGVQHTKVNGGSES
jgi:circadian clock protein KaiC